MNEEDRLRELGLKREMKHSKFLISQDNTGKPTLDFKTPSAASIQDNGLSSHLFQRFFHGNHSARS